MTFWTVAPNGGSKKNAAFSVLEIVVAVAALATVMSIAAIALNKNSKDNRLALVKTNMAQVHSSAQQSLAKYVSLQLENLIESTYLKACFEENGTNCDRVPPAFSGFTAVSGGTLTPYQVEMNKMLFSKYTLESRPCTASLCPLEVTSSWVYDCTPNTCRSITLNTVTTLNISALTSSDDKSLFAAFPKQESSFVYHPTKDFGLKSTIQSTCDSVTGVNFQANSAQCSDQASSSNRLLTTSIGLVSQNSALTLLPDGKCPPGQTSKVKPDGTSECPGCSVLCTDAGSFEKDCKCCKHGGWSAAVNEDVGSASFYYLAKLCNNPLPVNCGNRCTVESGYTEVLGSVPMKQRQMVCKSGYAFVGGVCKPIATNPWGPWVQTKFCDRTLGEPKMTQDWTRVRKCQQYAPDYAQSPCVKDQVMPNPVSGRCWYASGWYVYWNVWDVNANAAMRKWWWSENVHTTEYGCGICSKCLYKDAAKCKCGNNDWGRYHTGAGVCNDLVCVRCKSYLLPAWQATNLDRRLPFSSADRWPNGEAWESNDWSP